eukprot:TRINITY_DN2875_c0_g1_i1.p1 TRINITY_DN2875_c0_g1~~TRINITY_DN2875_c0_g1_i1.p1  ORF type:complete len:549 (+),score=74.83 TRINITY_DN2875_c0_g1_i1:99-1745(+)
MGNLLANRSLFFLSSMEICQTFGSSLTTEDVFTTGVMMGESTRSFLTPVKEFGGWDAEEILRSLGSGLSTGDSLASGVKARGLGGSTEEISEFGEIDSNTGIFKRRTVADRFIPNRKASHFAMFHDAAAPVSRMDVESTPEEDPEGSGNRRIDALYKRHLLGHGRGIRWANADRSDENMNILRFAADEDTENDPSSFLNPLETPELTRDGSSTTASRRTIAKAPYKVLDAPALQDDFYLNLLDWSAQNVIVVGLGPCVYLWSAQTGRVSKLMETPLGDSITSVSWSNKGNYLGVGTNRGETQVWDIVKMKKATTFTGHSARVGSLAWNSSVIATGSRDKTIIFRDVRARDNSIISRGMGHRQEVCGLKWSFDGQQLCSGGNDNKVMVWSLSAANNPIAKFNEHKAAVKALAWSPHQHGLLATGGGTADRTIRFWNTLTNTPVKVVDTGSQVCNLMFGRNVNELVSTHGYSYNEVNIWRYPSMSKTATLTGHTYRVLYLAMSPDGQNIVTGAGDETLRFWNVFPKKEDIAGENAMEAEHRVFPKAADLR